VRRTIVISVVGMLTATACPSRSIAGGGDASTLTVLAAASLTEAFERIGTNFERVHDGVAVRFSFGPSDGLAQQIQAGAPADVFASASPTWMDAVAAEPGVERRTDFAANRLVIITPLDDPANIRSVNDLARPGVKLVLAAEGVPVGDYARQMLQNAGVAGPALTNVVSNEEDVKGVVQKVLLGEADAGIVYVTDVTRLVHQRVTEVTIPDAVNVIATYPIAVVSTSEHRSLASALVSFVTGSSGRKTLAAFGFLPPD
jgi:molybdate transport system substrate-binding protein